MTTELRHINAAIERTKQRMNHLESLRDGLLKKTLITCHNCGANHEIGSIPYIQTHWYVEPYGCTGGDYYKTGEGKWDCPGCGFTNRLYDKPHIRALWNLFSFVIYCKCKEWGIGQNPHHPCAECVKAKRKL
jgi:hypothetical protein